MNKVTARGRNQRLSKKTIARAWVDPEFRARLSEQERALLPPNPAGLGIPEDALENVVGGFTFTSGCGTLGCFTVCPTETCTTPICA